VILCQSCLERRNAAREDAAHTATQKELQPLRNIPDQVERWIGAASYLNYVPSGFRGHDHVPPHMVETLRSVCPDLTFEPCQGQQRGADQGRHEGEVAVFPTAPVLKWVRGRLGTEKRDPICQIVELVLHKSRFGRSRSEYRLIGTPVLGWPIGPSAEIAPFHTGSQAALDGKSPYAQYGLALTVAGDLVVTGGPREPEASSQTSYPINEPPIISRRTNVPAPKTLHLENLTEIAGLYYSQGNSSSEPWQPFSARLRRQS
jgi:hypothetical protein